MALKSAAQIQPLSDRLNRIRLERFADPTSPAFMNCVTQGLIPQRNLNPGRTNTTYTAGRAIVAGVIHDVAAGTFPEQTAQKHCYCWVDTDGAVQIGEDWPEAAHAKICDMGVTTWPVTIDMCHESRKIGYDPSRQALVASPGEANVTTLYTRVTQSDASYERGVGTLGSFLSLPLVTGVGAHLSKCNTSEGHLISLRAGFLDPDSKAWIEGAYVDFVPTNGAGEKVGTLATPWVPTLGRNYIFACVAYEVGESYVAGDFGIYRGAQHLDYPVWADIRTDSSFAWNGTIWTTYGGENAVRLMMKGHASTCFYAEVLSDALVETPGTFQAALHARSRAPGTGLYSAYDPADQPVFFDVSLDNGAHWTRVVEGEDLTTEYVGTALKFRVVGTNRTADELELCDVGLSYEV